MRSNSGYGWQENQGTWWFSPMLLFILIGIFAGWGKAWIAFIIFPVVFGVGAYFFKQIFRNENTQAWTPEDIEKYKRGERLEYFDVDKRKNDDEEPLVYYVGDDGELIEMPREKPKRTDRYDQPPKYV